MSDNFLVTCFDEKYFNLFGASWFASLFDVSKFEGKVIAIAFDFKKQENLDVLQKHGINVIHTTDHNDKRTFAYIKIAELQKNNQGKYAYFDFDGYFRKDINCLFDMHENGLFLRSQNNNDGFVLGDNAAWDKFYEFVKFENFCKFRLSTEYFLLSSDGIKHIDNKFNYVEPSRLTSDSDACFVHYTGAIKNYINSNYDYNFSYAKQFPESYQNWQKAFCKKPYSVNRKFLFKKKNEKK